MSQKKKLEPLLRNPRGARPTLYDLRSRQSQGRARAQSTGNERPSKRFGLGPLNQQRLLANPPCVLHIVVQNGVVWVSWIDASNSRITCTAKPLQVKRLIQRLPPTIIFVIADQKVDWFLSTRNVRHSVLQLTKTDASKISDALEEAQFSPLSVKGSGLSTRDVCDPLSGPKLAPSALGANSASLRAILSFSAEGIDRQIRLSDGTMDSLSTFWSDRRPLDLIVLAPDREVRRLESALLKVPGVNLSFAAIEEVEAGGSVEFEAAEVNRQLAVLRYAAREMGCFSLCLRPGDFVTRHIQTETLVKKESAVAAHERRDYRQARWYSARHIAIHALQRLVKKDGCRVLELLLGRSGEALLGKKSNRHQRYHPSSPIYSYQSGLAAGPNILRAECAAIATKILRPSDFSGVDHINCDEFGLCSEVVHLACGNGAAQSDGKWANHSLRVSRFDTRLLEFPPGGSLTQSMYDEEQQPHIISMSVQDTDVELLLSNLYRLLPH